MRVNGSKEDGVYRDGLLHRTGHQKVATVYDYRGELAHGQPHGRGIAEVQQQCPALAMVHTSHNSPSCQYANGDRYEGYFQDGLRDRRGTLKFGSVKKIYDKVTTKTTYTSDFQYDGLWHCGDIRSRNVCIDVKKDSEFYTTNNRSERCVQQSSAHTHTRTRSCGCVLLFVQQVPEALQSLSRRSQLDL